MAFLIEKFIGDDDFSYKKSSSMITFFLENFFDYLFFHRKDLRGSILISEDNISCSTSLFVNYLLTIIFCNPFQLFAQQNPTSCCSPQWLRLLKIRLSKSLSPQPAVNQLWKRVNWPNIIISKLLQLLKGVSTLQTENTNYNYNKVN